MKYILILSILTFWFKTNAQVYGTVSINLPIVILLDIEPSSPITFNFSTITEAGNSIGSITNNTKWINYTSAILEGGSSRKIIASITEVIPGIDIKVQALNATGSGGGILGVPKIDNTQNTLGLVIKDIITGIKGAYTGNGQNNGHQLNITVSPNIYSNIKPVNNKIIYIIYTIVEE